MVSRSGIATSPIRCPVGVYEPEGRAMRKLVFSAALLVLLVIGVGSASATTIEDQGRASSAVLTPQTFTVKLSPSPTGDPDGSGTAELTVNLGEGTVCYDITVTGIGEPTEPAAGIGNAHIHSYPQN